MGYRYKSTALGRSVDMAGIFLPGSATQVQRSETLLVDGNADELFPQQAGVGGSWVLTVSSTILEGGDAGAFAAQVVPLVCRVTFGAGGITHETEVDAFPGFSLQLPTGTVRAVVYWENLPTTVGVAPTLELPNRVRVRASIHRGNCQQGARRSFLLNRDAGVAVNTTGLVPAFSKSAMFYADNTHQGYVNPSALILGESIPTATPGAITSRIVGASLLANLQAGLEAVVPAQSSQWQMQIAAGETLPGRLNFLIQL